MGDFNNESRLWLEEFMPLAPTINLLNFILFLIFFLLDFGQDCYLVSRHFGFCTKVLYFWESELIFSPLLELLNSLLPPLLELLF